ncbi:ABC transporter ATP-binding protein [Stutzerimonas nosocomialis]|uniref:ABC transporter ATP-binding protein n=1 Tax=Stutzerimonas nosocomialis TaxID=1056496 RepID=A0A5R9QIE7_9GAMM|nr:ABC transporter ATP-binding protein [Stutzerimonas nosocomialis]TLX57252.1 ABC transporter ATP-binding protein [Stutzerimonas nosocomialis]TLX59309.1 ABC transporter ATP-binding protein [Stutzerimonas nosocomialis]TLX64702.1 ABC transporter ATP-binding protein [Stutzerimonas nosocomialis]
MQLSFENVDKRFGELEVIKGFSRQIARGELVALVGPSGCGKSTLLHLVAGLEQPTAGRVLADGKAITGPSPRRTLVFQEHALYPWLSLQANVAMALELQGVARKQAFEQAKSWLARVNLTGFEKYYPHQVSGGMRQRTALARAFIAKPEVLLLDEPFGALDALTRMALQDVLGELIDEHRPTVLLVTHDVDEALYLADHILVFSNRPAQVLKAFDFAHCEKSHDLSGFAAERKEILQLLGIKTEVEHP